MYADECVAPAHPSLDVNADDAHREGADDYGLFLHVYALAPWGHALATELAPPPWQSWTKYQKSKMQPSN